jgi:hypothetical protein
VGLYRPEETTTMVARHRNLFRFGPDVERMRSTNVSDLIGLTVARA